MDADAHGDPGAGRRNCHLGLDVPRDKQSLPQMPPASFLVWRFGLAAIALLVARPRQLVTLTRAEELHRGLLLGVFLGSGFLLQTIGLLGTGAGVSGFLTGAAVVLTPLVAARWFKERVGSAGWVAVGVSTAGIALLMLRSATVTPATVLTVAGAACFALHISALSRVGHSRQRDRIDDILGQRRGSPVRGRGLRPGWTGATADRDDLVVRDLSGSGSHVLRVRGAGLGTEPADGNHRRHRDDSGAVVCSGPRGGEWSRDSGDCALGRRRPSSRLDVHRRVRSGRCCDALSPRIECC